MAIFEDHLLRLRPFLFHTTSRNNLESIGASRQLRSARSLLAGTEYEKHLRGRRLQNHTITINGSPIDIRDHRPLAPGAIDLQDGLTLDQYIAELNRRVFLWAGVEGGPRGRGLAHFQRYQGEGSVAIIRVPTQSMLATNTTRQLSVTRCNSGSARCHDGHPVPRGLSTFQPLESAKFGAADVVEITYIDWADLPENAQFAADIAGPWKPMWP